MQLPHLHEATLLRRYKRFLADLKRGDETFTAHCPNTGAMTGCAEPGATAWYSLSDNPKRKYPATFEMVQTPQGLCSVNTGRANALVGEAIRCGVIEGLGQVQSLQAEAPIPGGGGRFDFALGETTRTYVEVKSVTLIRAQGLGVFPDAVSTRALKHVRALRDQVSAGHRGVLVFCAQHTGVKRIAPATDIDPAYAAELADAMQYGVEIRAFATTVNLKDGQMCVTREIPFLLEPLSE